jgi:hypothetical protein
MDIVERLREENEQLRQQNAELVKVLTGLYEACKWEKISPEIDAARRALGEKE